MRLKSGVAFNEKGNMVPAVRKFMVNYVANHRDCFAKAEQVGDKAVFVLPVQDAEGNVFYVNFDVSVSGQSAANRAVKVRKAKDAEAVDVE